MNDRQITPECVVTIMTSYLCCSFDELCDALEALCGELPYTSQIPRFLDECRPWLIRWFPALASDDCQAEFRKLGALLATESGKQSPEFLIVGWMSRVIASGHLQESYAVGCIPADDHEIIDVYDELVVAAGTDEHIIMVDHEENDDDH